MKHHIVSIDNDFGHIAGVKAYSSHDSLEEAEKALDAIQQRCQQAHVDKRDREEENHQRYVEWASNAIVQCPNQFGGFNWIKHPGDQHHLAHIKNVPYHTVRECDGQDVVTHDLIRVKANQPLMLLEELSIPPECWLEYHLVDNKE